MHLSIAMLVGAAWSVFLVYWAASAGRVKYALRSEPLGPRLFKYWIPLAAAAALVQPVRSYPSSALHWRFLPDTPGVAMLGMAMCWAGVLVACHARRVLGANWSSEVQVKQDHELVVRGPYRLARHPIYTGLLLALLGSALALGEVRGLLAFAIVATSFWFKLRLEERWMREQFGSAYVDYMRRTKRLVPGIF